MLIFLLGLLLLLQGEVLGAVAQSARGYSPLGGSRIVRDAYGVPQETRRELYTSAERMAQFAALPADQRQILEAYRDAGALAGHRFHCHHAISGT
jgi:hypothetical protein